MVVPKQENFVYDIKFSSVVPGKVTGENKNHELTGIDLAMKLHYIKGLYFFKNKTNINCDGDNVTNCKNSSLVENIHELKPAMFDWLVPYVVTCGRIRTSPENGERPAIKLNDAGIRIVEARSDKTVDEWLAMEGFMVLAQDQLVYGEAIGENGMGLGFTPLVFIQVTWFKCGGISVGLNWAHVLGDVSSASTFMNMFGRYLQGHQQQVQIASYRSPQKPNCPPRPRPIHEPNSLKRVSPNGDRWTVATNSTMVTHSFHLTTNQLTQLLSKVYDSPKDDKKGITDQYFEVISAILWKSIARIRKDLEPKVVTICKPKSNTREKTISHYNDQVLGTIKVNSSISQLDIPELVSLIDKNIVDETKEVEELVDEENDKGDFVVYGSNLTFVNMETTNIYDFKINGQNPAFVVYTVNEVGEKGVVLVLPGVKDGKKDVANNGKLIVVVLPGHELEGLKEDLREQWSIM